MKRQKKEKLKVDRPVWLIQAMRVLRPPENLTVSQWADKYRILDEKISAQPGPWRTFSTPYLKGIMDAFNDPDIEEIIFVKCTQVGGTEAMNNMLGYAIQQDPSSTMFVLPTLQLAEFASENRIQTMVDAAPTLKERYWIRDSKKLELQFDGMYLVLAGANSAASLASRPIRYLLLDEVDKYPARCGDEADPISLAKERTKTFSYNKKIALISTPTIKSGNIWQAWERCDEQRFYYVPCPHCGQYQCFTFKQLKWPKEITDPTDARDLAYYECVSCKGTINDSHKMMMLRSGKWTGTKKRQNGRSVGFHINVLYSPWIRFGDIAYEFLKSKDFPDLLRNFINSWLGEPWEEASVKLSSDVALERQCEYEEGVVPGGTILLTGGVDVQENMLYWTIRAWGPMLTSWNIAHGTALDFSDIEFIMNQTWSTKDGKEYQVNLCAIDSGDRTDDVYEFCAYNQDWAIPVKGSSNPMFQRFRISTIDKVDSKAYGQRLIIVDTAQYKNMIASRMNKENGRGSWMVYRGCDMEYAQQVTSEQKVKEKRGAREVEIWKPKTSSTPNHFLDTEVYAAVAADLLHVRYASDEQKPEETPEQKPQAQENNFIKAGSDWIHGKGGWIRR